MSDQTNTAPKTSGLDRRSVLRAAAAAMAIPAVARATAAFAKEKLSGSGEVVVFVWGGSTTEAVRKNVFEPFTSTTGIKVSDVVGDIAEPQVKAMNQAGRVDWDIAPIQASTYPAMSQAGMFVPIDYSLWDDESIEGVPKAVRMKDAFPVIQSGQVLAYDERVFGKNGPKNWADFWNVKAFPGPRGLYAPIGKFSIIPALLADGVAKTDIWPLTDDKIDRAFKKLDEIKPHVAKWWTSGGESGQLLVNREYVMTTAYEATIIVLARQGAPLGMVWDNTPVNYTYWTVLKGGPNNENAQKLIAFVNRAKIAAGWTLSLPEPGPNVHQLQYLPSDLVPLLSISHPDSLIIEDSAWLGTMRPDGKTNYDHIQERWLAWRAR
ncbi:ABC transporter substrate-binding protein [Bradyrhizobium canariense]|uniref:ABC transporter substrate-binding protein n=1 Tax=Bradyrhizobium TaxID=374 RepID=UPI000A18D052|nr:ABC transporter substrate-binding protein [Bradyrhizobium canariense]OSI32949.1 hypothetical protein BST65_03450 [Bradyrhizobium canariense]OSI36923.1 hypothetical protein BST66_04810 [Bradyrhizobium canariense]OSI50370.1 hypothetical protein BSZ20_06010 [Bradyrhizobium canariense]OSI55791.1 hypothetical protein BST67_04615 [Bradyrhizobium canariense]OSI59046.1 hypothetical protein BSZ15_06550 [Bradyrhizobium canariense]